MRTVTDQTGRSFLVTDPPERIVSLVPSLTELLFDLGLDSEIVGVTRFCVHPADRVAGRCVVGGPEDLDIAAIDRLRPDLIVGSMEENRRDDVEQLAERYPVWLGRVADLGDALEMIRMLGEALSRSGPAREMADAIAAGFAGLVPLSRARRVAYLVWRGPLMAAGGQTLIGDLLTRCGMVNAFGDVGGGRYPELAVEALVAARLDLILLPSEPFPFGPQDRIDFQDLVPGASVVLVDGEMFSWYGSRLRLAVPYLQDLVDRLAGAG